MMTLDGNYYFNKAREGRITIAELLGSKEIQPRVCRISRSINSSVGI